MFVNFEKYLNIPLPKRPIFFDVGANKGQWIEKIISIYPECIIYAFEPIPGITPQYDNVKLLNYAIDIIETRGKSRNFYITKDNVTSSLLELESRLIGKFIDFEDENGNVHKKSDFDIHSVIKVETKRLDNFIDQNSISEIHYLKIDAEGNDLNVFKSLGERYNIVWGFEIEVWNEELTLYKGSAWRNQCLGYIKSKGFSVVEKFIHGKGKSTDFLFVRNSLIK